MKDSGKKAENTLTETALSLGRALEEELESLSKSFGGSFDLIIRRTRVGRLEAAYAALDGMYDSLLAASAVVEPVSRLEKCPSQPDKLISMIKEDVVFESDIKTAADIGGVCESLLSGCLVLLVDGADEALAFSVQGFAKRGVERPESETQENGSQEGFADMFKDNVTLVRRRLKTELVRFETVVVGATSKTSVCICYHSRRADPSAVESVRRALTGAKLDIVCGAGSLRPFLERRRPSFFTSVGETQRPDVLAAKLAEGRIGVIVDGTVQALIVPYLFIENFHTLDDYLNRPYYTAISRLIKLIGFFTAVFLPGIYVSVGTFHQELFPSAVIYEIISAMQNTPFPLVIESLVIHFIYEIVREAGLRMPKSLGHTVSIVGTLVIGDAAVRAGLVCAPMLIILAVTTVCSSVVPSLHQPSSVLRLIFILLGGSAGLYGIMLGFMFLITDICSLSSLGVAFTSPASPFDKAAMRDALIFASWRRVGSRAMKIGELKGSKRKK